MRAPLRVCFLLAVLAGRLPAQGVLVAPHSIFIDHRSRGGFVELYNPEARPVEVTIGTLYGYPVTDSTGQLGLHVIDAPAASEPSAVAWIVALPRRMVIQPLTKQTVRLLGRPPAGLADGEYWARLVISAKAGQLPVAVSGVDSASGIQVGLNLEVRTIIPVYYRKGAVGTGLTLSDVRTSVEADSIGLRVRLTRTGNAAFIGTVRGSLRNETNREVGAFRVPIAVYYQVEPRFALARAGLPPGRYTLHLEVTAERGDIPPDQLLPVRAVRASTEIVVR
ncbi:MAG: hypothetical protein ACRENB_00475 [Gemmatimonadales bacterium]